MPSWTPIGRAVVAGSELRAPMICGGDGCSFGLARCVALVAEGLTLVGTDLYRAWSVPELRNRKQGCGEVQLLATVVEGNGVADWRGGDGDPRRWLGLRWAFAVQLVAGHAGDGWFVRK